MRLAISAAEAAQQQTVRRTIPAWLLSLALHLAVLLSAALLFRTFNVSQAPDEPSRGTSIVLLSSNDTHPPQYFSADERADHKSARFAAGSGGAGALDSQALSPLASDPPISGIMLPSAQGPAVDPGWSATSAKAGAGAGGGRRRFGGLSDADVAAILAEDAARWQKSAPSGPTAQLSLFGSAPAEGRSFVFLIDRSQSMGHAGLGAIAAAAKELAASIDALGPEQKFQVIAYNQKPLALGGRETLMATPENKRKLIEFVEGIVAVGATEHELGLYAALRYKPDVIFLFTDGGDPRLNPGQLKSIREAVAGHTAIHCLHFGSGTPAEDENFLARLAKENGGSYVYIDVNK
ncbi:MAG TPA: VWA domain-containing protein [Pirellulaceae bacterium]|nr:VWA domain-containing protein [Pirellulaceae bacterium]